MSEERYTKGRESEFINWKRFKQRILLNKRIWKYVALFAFCYSGSKRFVFDEWYKAGYKPKVSFSRPLSYMDRDEQMIQNVIVLNSHKPSSNLVILICQIIHCHILLYRTKCRYTFISLQERGNALHPNYKNKDVENEILDIHIAVWSFLIFVDGLNCLKKKSVNKSDKIMMIHHLIALCISSIYKYHNNGGPHWSWVAFWSEGIGIFAMIGALLRVIYQRDGPI